MRARLTRFLFRWSKMLRDYPVAFDAQREKVALQGGDLIVADERTVFLGIGNLSEEAAARKLARVLDMDVISVQMPASHSRRGGGSIWNPLRTQFLHLDTIFSLVGPRHALAVPYFLEISHSGHDPLSELLGQLAEESVERRGYYESLSERLAAVGFVKRYRARSGDIDPTVRDVKLVDYVRSLGYRVTHVGGNPPKDESTQHVVERVLRELRFQGGNVVAIRPGEVIAYDGNRHTLAALQEDGIAVSTFPGSELLRWHGGPHCLTLPLERGPS